MKKGTWFKKRIFPLVFIIPFFISGCLFGDEGEEVLPAQYGDQGAQWAVSFARAYPMRTAYSSQERQAGEMVKSEFERMGYEVEVQNFSSADGTGQSANYIVRIPGEGFMERVEDDEYVSVRRTVIVGAHYDTPGYPDMEADDRPVLQDDIDEAIETEENMDEQVQIFYDGLHNNASGVACLLIIAEQMKDITPAYDVVLVAFGASSDDFAGARAFADQLSWEEVSSTDVMYCIESIYAGDKLYASAGHNSLEPDRKYERRRKLYEAYDVVYNNMLRSKNNVDLLYNMSSLVIDVNGDDQLDIYREVTMTQSDYVPFDELNIPIVFIESYDYNYGRFEDMKETRNLNLQDEGGYIRGTLLDASELLLDELGEELLIARINNTAFIIFEAIKKGAHDILSQSDYDGGQRLPTAHEVSQVQTDRGFS